MSAYGWNIVQACYDRNLGFHKWLADRNERIGTWLNWLAMLRALYGLEIPTGRHAVVAECTGRDVNKLPEDGFDTALFLTGRRSGKSRMAAIIGAYEAVLAGHHEKLAKGEQGIVAVVAPTKKQSQIVKGYLRAIFQAPMLTKEVLNETKDGFLLRNGNKIDILTGDFRSVRGYTLLAAIIDEAAFLGLDDDAKVKSDTELVRAMKPALATVGGKLIAITSPYARRGWTFKTYERNFGNDAGKTLVVNAASSTLNPTLPQSVVDDAMAEDRSSALSEYYGQFRDDVGEFLSLEVIRSCVVEGRQALAEDRNKRYFAFADVSGGRADASALAIAHRTGRKIILDRLVVVKPPFNPNAVIAGFCQLARSYGCRVVTGDNYAAEFVAEAFRANGMNYMKSELNKSALYLELIPKMCSGEVELLDFEPLINQLANLERRTRSGGKDIVDHPPSGHDDAANAAAGAIFHASKTIVAGVF